MKKLEEGIRYAGDKIVVALVVAVWMLICM
jgi:hypothetical protein